LQETKVAPYTRRYKVENASYMARYWNEISPEKAGVGESIPPSEII
jgi:hypothetical protein